MEEKAGGAGTTTDGQRSKHLTRDELISRLSVRREEYQLPEEVGGGTVILQGLSVDAGMEELRGGATDTADRMKKILLLGIAEPKLDLADLEALGQASVGLLDRISDVILRLSGFNIPDLQAFLAAAQDSSPSSASASKNSTGSRRK